MQRWHRRIVWKVQHRLPSGDISCRWFKREESARDYAKLISQADIVEISFTVRECPQYGLIDDELHWVVNP